MDELIGKLEIELKLRGFSRKTIKAYLFHTSYFLKHVGVGASQDESRRHFATLSERLDPRTVNLQISAVKFFYRNVLEKEINVNFMKRPKRLPEVLTKEEVASLLTSITNPKHRLLLETLYGCGLRVSEAAKLKKEDIRFNECIVFIRQGKGNKDRAVSLPSYRFTHVKQIPEGFAFRHQKSPFLAGSTS